MVQSLVSCLFDYKRNSLPPVLAFAIFKADNDDNLFLLNYSHQKLQERSEMIRIIAANKRQNFGKDLVQILTLGHPADIYLLFREGFINASDLSDENKLSRVIKNVPRVQWGTKNVFDNKALAMKHLFLVKLFGFFNLHKKHFNLAPILVHYNMHGKDCANYLEMWQSMSWGMKSLQSLARSKLHLMMPGGTDFINKVLLHAYWIALIWLC